MFIDRQIIMSYNFYHYEAFRCSQMYKTSTDTYTYTNTHACKSLSYLHRDCGFVRVGPQECACTLFGLHRNTLVSTSKHKHQKQNTCCTDSVVNQTARQNLSNLRFLQFFFFLTCVYLLLLQKARKD